MKTRLAYFTVHYPTLSQTFIQREIEGLCKHGFEVWVFCCLPARKTGAIAPPSDELFAHLPIIKKLTLFQILTLPCLVLLLLLRRPWVVWHVLRLLRRYRWSGWENVSANFIGACAGLIYAHEIRIQGMQVAHGTWATMPAAAAATVAYLLRIPFSFGAHAYDLYRHGGDGFLKEKMEHAVFIHTTTQTNVNYLSQQYSGVRSKIVLARRGLPQLPVFFQRTWEHHSPLHILSVGRLVAKKGHLLQLQACHMLKKQGWSIHLNIVGEGPERLALQKAIATLELNGEVSLLGALPAALVHEQYLWAELFWHTGIVDSEGDRDGLPNVIPEAMAYGIPIISSAQAGVCEAVEDRKTGLVVNVARPQQIVDAMIELKAHEVFRKQLAKNARAWVEQHFMTEKNTAILARAFAQARRRRVRL